MVEYNMVSYIEVFYSGAYYSVRRLLGTAVCVVFRAWLP